jgi:hypothetical protein
VAWVVDKQINDNLKMNMKTYTSIETLIKDRENLDWDAWLYCNLNQWEKNPSNTTIYHITEYHITEDEALEYEEDEDTGLPIITVDLDVDTFLEVERLNQLLMINSLRGENQKQKII